jgi:lycopene cyclase domain-containing protein
MTYLIVDAYFLSAAAIVAGIWLRGRWIGVAAKSLTVMLAMTAVFDNLIVGLGIVRYHTEQTLGINIGVAPIEDFGYSIAAVLLITTLWSKLSQGEK